MSREEALESMRSSLSHIAGPFGQISIQGVDVQGRCASSLLQAHIKPLFNATNVDELVDAINRVQASLFGLDLFKDVSLSITPDKIISISLPAKNKFVARVGTNVGQSEGSGYIRGTMCNASGWGEILTIDTSAGTRTKSSHLISASIPLPFEKAIGWKAEALAYSSEKVLEWASCKAYVKGLTARFSKGNGSSFGLDAVLRTTVATKLNASRFICNDVGNNFKYSLFYNWRHDTRIPTDTFTGDGKGYMIDLHNEVALNPSTSPFYKFVFKFQSAFKIFKGVTGAFNSKCGLVLPISPNVTTHVLDRMNIGGPMDLRGFRMNHAGPHEGKDATGGDMLTAVGLSFFTPIPKVASPNIKLHNFWNAGILTQLPSTTLQVDKIPSLSTGLGIIYTHPSARFELNITLPLVAHANELVHKGLQFGVGLEFL